MTDILIALISFGAGAYSGFRYHAVTSKQARGSDGRFQKRRK